MRKAYDASLVPTVIFSKDVMNENDLWEKVRPEVQCITPFATIWKPRPSIPSSSVVQLFGKQINIHIDTANQDRLDFYKSMWEQKNNVDETYYLNQPLSDLEVDSEDSDTELSSDFEELIEELI